MTIELICFDMAGTTVNDQGLVLDAFRRTIDELGVTGDDAGEAEAYVISPRLKSSRNSSTLGRTPPTTPLSAIS